MSGSYSINGTPFIIQPTEGQWIRREALGVDGQGHPIYPGVREFELVFNVSQATGTYQLQQFYQQIAVTGTAVVELPRYGYFDYDFFRYSGCVLSEPEFGKYFAQHTLDVSLIISNIRT